jgi:predicted tellurium resistance membrane protein TerC
MKQRPQLITDARISQEAELKRRERRYILMMGLRAACVIVGVVLVMAKAPLLGLWLPLCGLGMVLLPWLAVILANDRPPKDRHRMKRYRGNTAPANALPTQASGKTIDLEEED